MTGRLEADARGFVGILAVELHFPELGSLKAKRMFLRKLRDTVSRRYNASVCEVAYQDLWQRSRVLIAIAASDTSSLDRTLNAITGYLYSQDWQVTDIQEEVVEIDGT